MQSETDLGVTATNSRERRVLIVEQRHSGHLLVYVRELIEEIMARGERPLLALGASVVGTDEFESNIAPFSLPIYTFDGELTPRLTRRLGRQAAADAIIVPHADELAVRMGLSWARVNLPIVMLIMRDPAWEWASRSWLRRLKLRSKHWLIQRTSQRQNVSVVWLRSFGYRGDLPHVVDPFIADAPLTFIGEAGAQTRDRLGMSSDTFWFVVTGAITDRKNLPIIVASLREAKRRNPGTRIGLALIGPQRMSRPYDQLIPQVSAETDIELVTDDRLLSNLEMNAAVAASDAVLMAYSSTSPNSTMLKALALGRRLVVAGPSSVQSFARGMGFELVASLEVEALTAVIERALTTQPPACAPPVPTGRDFATVLIDATH